MKKATRPHSPAAFTIGKNRWPLHKRPGRPRNRVRPLWGENTFRLCRESNSDSSDIQAPNLVITAPLHIHISGTNTKVVVISWTVPRREAQAIAVFPVWTDVTRTYGLSDMWRGYCTYDCRAIHYNAVALGATVYSYCQTSNTLNRNVTRATTRGHKFVCSKPYCNRSIWVQAASYQLKCACQLAHAET
jgi:hypothetical protein